MFKYGEVVGSSGGGTKTGSFEAAESLGMDAIVQGKNK